MDESHMDLFLKVQKCWYRGVENKLQVNGREIIFASKFHHIYKIVQLRCKYIQCLTMRGTAQMYYQD